MKKALISPHLFPGIIAALTVQVLGLTAERANAGLVEFSIPNTNLTTPSAINDKSWIAGSYLVNDLFSGFQRAPDGSITTFNVAGAEETEVSGLNDSGVIAGVAIFSGGSSYEGFTRTSDGTITTFEVPSATYTTPTAINKKGTIVGWVNYSLEDRGHAFVRSDDGIFTVFDVSGATTTQPMGINNKGEVSGEYQAADGSIHGFFRAARGTITTFDPLGAELMEVGGINASGDITGSCAVNKQITSFVRKSDGTFIFPNNKLNAAVAINKLGTITGRYFHGKKSIAFTETADGKIMAFGDKGDHSTNPSAINGKGVVVGSIQRDPDIGLGFIYTP